MSRFAPTSAPTRVNNRPFAWSYSKLKNFESCAKRHYHVDIKKDVVEEESAQLALGNEAHAALAKAVMGTAPLPEAFAPYQHWVDKIVGAPAPNVQILVERQLAISEFFLPAPWFKKSPAETSPWFRGIIDVLKLVTVSNGQQIALVADWKTGKVVEDSVQLALFAQCVFAHYPLVERVRTEFIWLADDCTTRDDFTRQDMPELWAALNPRVGQQIEAAKTGEYPPKPGYLCKRYCPVTSCVHHGK